MRMDFWFRHAPTNGSYWNMNLGGLELPHPTELGEFGLRLLFDVSLRHSSGWGPDGLAPDLQKTLCAGFRSERRVL